MKKLLPLLLLLSISTQAQELLHCGADEMRIQTLQANPKIAQAVIERDAELEAFTRDYAASTRGGQVYTIPVVYHVIHKYGNENISEEQLMDGLRILNETFRKTREDTADIHPDFKPIHTDCEVEFKLATKDPEGNCHSGINRIASTLTNSGDHRVKELVHWDPTMYLNVYVVSNAAGLAGHCVWPADADTIPEWDGIVIAHSYVGTIGTSDLTRSVAFAHECGHYLNLHHIWGGNNVPEFYYLPVGQQSNCGEDDLVGDTPNTIGWSSCNLNASSCGNTRDNVQNAMDYSYCNIMFTEGQKTRMHACLNSSIANRNNLWTPTNLVATGVESPAKICAVDFEANKRVVCSNFDNEVTFTNLSYHGDFDSVYWEFPGGVPSTSTDIQPTITYNTPGSHTPYLRVYADGELRQNSKENYITVLADAGTNYPFSEPFQASNPSWQENSLDTINHWRSSELGYVSSGYSMMLDNWSSDRVTVDELYGPTIDLSGASEMRLAFKYAFASSQEVTSTTRLVVQVRKNCESNWSTRLNLIGSNLETAPQQTEPFEPLDDGSLWALESISIPTSSLTENFQFRFVYTSEGLNRLFIDDVNIDVNAAIEEVTLLPNLTVYPNPADDHLTLEFNLTEEMNLGFGVYDLLGKQLISVPFTRYDIGEAKFNVDVSSLSLGVYFLSVTSDDGHETKRFMVR